MDNPCHDGSLPTTYRWGHMFSPCVRTYRDNDLSNQWKSWFISATEDKRNHHLLLFRNLRKNWTTIKKRHMFLGVSSAEFGYRLLKKDFFSKSFGFVHFKNWNWMKKLSRLCFLLINDKKKPTLKKIFKRKRNSK